MYEYALREKNNYKNFESNLSIYSSENSNR